eukprot:scaffold102_cov340-Pavlova_lutheri.AAC.24
MINVAISCAPSQIVDLLERYKLTIGDNDVCRAFATIIMADFLRLPGRVANSLKVLSPSAWAERRPVPLSCAPYVRPFVDP